ncbi:MAG TPA: hypothetical protein VK463_08565 [Desulfomonilaceae bacterium]|nr:hypothetical protein [Desulfomonilaceae bacterium]
MKFLLCLTCFLAVALPCSRPNPAGAQAVQYSGSSNTDQNISHQMNQPPPSHDRFAVSQDRLDEIRQLYLQAKQEAEKKAVHKDEKK